MDLPVLEQVAIIKEVAKLILLVIYYFKIALINYNLINGKVKRDFTNQKVIIIEIR